VLTLVKQLKAANVPIDGIGLQMHISIDSYPSAASISANMADLAALGMEVEITEMDVKVSNPTPARLQLQAQVYGDILQACLDNTNCKASSCRTRRGGTTGLRPPAAVGWREGGAVAAPGELTAAAIAHAL